MSHDHTLYQDDNALVYEFIEEALRSSSMALTIQPYKRKKDGRKSQIALKEQHAGLDKWVAEIKKEEISLKQKFTLGNNKVDTLQRCIVIVIVSAIFE